MLLSVNLSAEDNEHGMLHGPPRKNLKASCPLQNTAHISKYIALKPEDEPAYLNELYSHCISSHFDFDTSWQLNHFFIIKYSRKS